jgi:hypothetical protein
MVKDQRVSAFSQTSHPHTSKICPMIDSEKPTTYLTTARQGLCRLRDYLAAIAIAFTVTIAIYTFFYIVGIFIWSLISRITFNESSAQLQVLIKESLYFNLAYILLGSNAYLFGLVLAVEGVHKRNFITLINTKKSFDWDRISKSFGFSFGFSSIYFLVSMLIKPSRFVLNLNFQEWLPFALITLVVIPVSFLALFLWLGYLIQGVDLLLRKPIFSVIFWGLLLGSFGGFTPKWFTGVFCMMFTIWIIIKDNRLELAIGMATANSIFSNLFFIRPDSIPKTPAFFTVIENTNPFQLFIAYAIEAALFYFVFFVLLKKPPKSLPSAD